MEDRALKFIDVVKDSLQLKDAQPIEDFLSDLEYHHDNSDVYLTKKQYYQLVVLVEIEVEGFKTMARAAPLLLIEPSPSYFNKLKRKADTLETSVKHYLTEDSRIKIIN